MSKMSDLELVDLVLAGQKDDFALLVQRYQTKIYGTIYKILLDRQEAEDAAQEIFLKAYRYLSSFQREASFSTWIYRIAVNYCVDVQRKRRDATVLLNEENLLSPADGPEVTVLRGETWSEIEQAVNSLTPEARAVVVLRLYAELPFEDIGAILSIPAQTAKMRFFRAKQHLRVTLQDYKLTKETTKEGVR